MQQDAVHDVVQIGYGPVSQALALMRARQGHRVVVAERRSEPYALPRAVCTGHEAARVLHAIGMGDGLARVSQPAPLHQWFNARWEQLLCLDWSADSVSGGPEVNLVHAEVRGQPQAGRRVAVGRCRLAEVGLRLKQRHRRAACWMASTGRRNLRQGLEGAVMPNTPSRPGPAHQPGEAARLALVQKMRHVCESFAVSVLIRVACAMRPVIP